MAEVKRKTVARNQVQKKTLSKGQVKEDFIDIGGRIAKDVIWPKTKDILSASLDYILYGEVRSRTSTSKPMNVINFTDYQNGGRTSAPVPTRNNYSAGSRDRWHFEDVIFDTAEEATNVWYQLRDILAAEHRIDINRYYDVCRADVDVPYTFINYGWTDIGLTPQILQKQYGSKYKYIIALPNIRYIGGR